MTLSTLRYNKTGKVLALVSALFLFISSFSITLISVPTTANACNCCATCSALIGNCSSSTCACQSTKETGKTDDPKTTLGHITKQFIIHREWLVKILFEAHVLPAMMLMTEQISALAIHQVLVVGGLFDAKHQLETQRLLQEMQAQAHKDYQPSTGMCQFGTNTRSLAASDRNAHFTEESLIARSMQRQLQTGDLISLNDRRGDSQSRFSQFQNIYCNPKDFGEGLGEFCLKSDPKRFNKDINYTQTIDAPYSLKIDFTKTDATKDSEDVLALSANLYGHRIMPSVPEYLLAKNGIQNSEGAFLYMKIRSLATKRSVAQASYAAQAALRAQGEKEVLPYMEAILKEMGIEEKDIKTMLGERPSYYAQMEFLTKKLYQTPNFYTELYDKPTNIDRKNVSMQAIGLMQRRDMFLSQQRTESISAVWLETALKELEDFYINESNPMKPNSEILKLEGLN